MRQLSVAGHPLAGEPGRESALSAVFDSVDAGLLLWSSSRSRLLAVNDRLLEMIGCDRGEAGGLKLADLCRGPTPFRSQDAVRRVRHATRGRSQAFEWLTRDRQGHLLWAEVSLRRVGPFAGGDLLVVVRDLSRSTGMARPDGRAALAAMLAESGHSAMAGFLLMDLDNFKMINDCFGHAHGDRVLQAFERRLQDALDEGDLVMRHRGDEFMAFLPGLGDSAEISGKARDIVEALSRPLMVDGREHYVTASIGGALVPDDGVTVDLLLSRAGAAVIEAKEAGRNGYRLFSPTMRLDHREALDMRNALRRALGNGEFVLYYQPQIDLGSLRLVGVEALIRWQHPERGLVAPGAFIPAAEESGLIGAIGDWVLQEACLQARRWQDSGLPKMSIAVNMSAVQFRRGDVVDIVRRALHQSGLDPRCLELELTESILVKDTVQVVESVEALKALGVRFSFDDFGTGYSSLAYLQRLSFDKLKIDQSFIRGMASTPQGHAIVRAILQLAKDLRLKTVAEGVETAEVMEVLRRYHCDEAQGYLMSRPLPPRELEGFLRGALANGQACSGQGARPC